MVSRSPSKTKLIERLNNRSTQRINLSNAQTDASIKKRVFAKSLRKQKVKRSISGKDLEYCLQAIRGLSVRDAKDHSKYLRELLRMWFNKHYGSAKGSLADNLRRTICWMDEALYMEDAK